MWNRPSANARAQALRAALTDAAALGAMLGDESVATYRGTEQGEYVRVLGSFVEDFGGRLESTPTEVVAVFGQRRIKLRFG